MKVICARCKIEKNDSEYYRSFTKKNGLLCYCKKCSKEINRKWANENRERKNRIGREWKKSNPERLENYKPKKRISDRESIRRWRANNVSKNSERTRVYSEIYPERRRAYKEVEKAIKSGKLKKSPCEVCGTEESIHAHHDDYDFPLKVRWVCPIHHTKIHQKINAKNKQRVSIGA